MGEKKLTIDDVARELGVSKTTVSRAISGKGRIGSETKARVLQYVKEHNYRPNVIARGLAQSRTYNIGLVLPEDYRIAELPFFQTCMLGVSKVASGRDYDVLISMVTADDISQLRRAVVNHKIDGVILTRTLVEDQPAKYLKQMQIPFIAIGSAEDDTIIRIDNDHRRACRELTGRLLAKGMKNIALIGGSRSHVVNCNRLAGFLDAYDEAGFAPGSEQICMDVEDEEEVREVLEKQLGRKVDCVIGMDDYLCNCILNELQQRQIAIPDQIKVASFYDSSYLANHIPSVTSIRFDMEELGEKSCGMLLSMIEGEEVPHKLLLGYRVLMRESTG